MRLIDADALMREFAEFVRESNNSDFADIPTWNDAVSLLGSAPTIDAVPVVRCRECKWWKSNDCKNDTHGYVPLDENDFCSPGERKDKT